ncbi:MAG: hypothetical protein WD872_16085 [Pirellulaceae bacterium]
MAVGAALAEIRDSKLYRSPHRTFELYLRHRWQMERSYAYRLIEASATATRLESAMREEVATEKLSPIGDSVPTRPAHPESPPNMPAVPSVVVRPKTESQVRPLVNLPPEKQVAVWKEACARSDNRPTARDIEQVVRENTGDYMPPTFIAILTHLLADVRKSYLACPPDKREQLATSVEELGRDMRDWWVVEKRSGGKMSQTGYWPFTEPKE